MERLPGFENPPRVFPVMYVPKAWIGSSKVKVRDGGVVMVIGGIL
jgi:hypothetical protein